MKVSNKVELFIDSGAYSALTQGVKIDIQEYIKFIQENEDVISIYSNLDVIGDAEATWVNQLIMEKAGLNPIPCFHFGENIKWLKLYLEKYDYIALGGMVGASNKALMDWLDPLWANHICNEEGLPKIKIHGFGLTSLPLMVRYPWYSIDSTSWVVTGRMGGIFIPRWANNQWIYDGASWKISVSNRSPDRKEEGQHIDTLTPLNREIVMKYIKEKGYSLGKSRFELADPKHELAENERWAEKSKGKGEKRKLEIIEEPGVSNRYQLRDEMNIIYFLDLENTRPKWPWAFKTKEVQNGLF